VIVQLLSGLFDVFNGNFHRRVFIFPLIFRCICPFRSNFDFSVVDFPFHFWERLTLKYLTAHLSNLFFLSRDLYLNRKRRTEIFRNIEAPKRNRTIRIHERPDNFFCELRAQLYFAFEIKLKARSRCFQSSKYLLKNKNKKNM
jgi:hypothetical protein